MSIDKKMAQVEIDALKERLAKLEVIIHGEDEVEPWAPKGGSGCRRSSGRPGDYRTEQKKYLAWCSGYSRTEEQALARSLIDKVNDILWGLKMTLEPDWVADFDNQDQPKNYPRYDRIFGWCRSLKAHKTECPSSIAFSNEAIDKVNEYLNKHYLDGITL